MMSQKEMIVMEFEKEFNRLYFLMKAYWYGTEEYENIPEFKEWASDYITDLLHDYYGECTISSFKKYLKTEVNNKIKFYINHLSKEVNIDAE